MNYRETIEKLAQKTHEYIPDTRKLQEVRLENINEVREERIHKNESEEIRKAPRIILLSKEEQKQIYTLSIPLSFPSRDFTKSKKNSGVKTDYFRFQGDSNQRGAMHLTTSINLYELIKIFARHEIPVKLETAYGNVFDLDRERRPAITVPHSWYEETYSPCFFRHQFVVCEQEVVGVHFVALEELVLTDTREQTEDNTERRFSPEEIRFTSTGNATIRRFYCGATFTSPIHVYKPESYLEKNLNERIKGRIGQREYNYGMDLTVTNAKVEIVHLSEPLPVFDPKWVEEGHKPLWARPDTPLSFL